MHTDIERRNRSTTLFRFKRANLPSRLRIREERVEPNNGRDEVNVSLDFDGNPVLITSKIRLLCFGVLINLDIINVVKLFLETTKRSLYILFAAMLRLLQ